jgi:hypothetical protein
MTPPLNPVQGKPAPLPPLPAPAPAPSEAPKPSLAGKSSYVALNGGETAAFKTKAELSAALSDARLFGSALKDYEAGKSDKYLRVSVALDAIRSAIAGDGKSATAVQRISMWLSDATLLNDLAVAHVARVNLVKVLKQAPKDPSIDESVKAILEALQKNYGSQAPKKEAPPAAPAEAPKTLSAQLEDANLFGEHFKDYEAKKNKEYALVNLALTEIRKLATGKTKDADPVKIRVERWLGDSTLLVDKVPTQARVNLIKVLSAAPSSDSNNVIIAALKANYSSQPAKKEEAAPPSEVKTETAKGVTTYKTKPNAKSKASRDDTAQTFQSGLNPALKRIFERFLKSSPNGITAEMTVTVNEQTGEITDVSFTNVKSGAGEGALKSFFNEAANALRTRFRFKPGTFDSGGFGFIKAKVVFSAQ